MSSQLVFKVPNFPGKEKLVHKTSMLGLKIAQKSPELCVGAGIVLGVGATVLACRATLRVEEIFDTHNETLEKINTLKTKAEEGNSVKGYSVEEAQKEKFILFVQTAAKIGKLYAPAIITGMAAIGFVLGGHHILMKRNAALTVAYAAVQKAYDEYRARVREVVGEDKENDIYNGIREVVTEEVNEKGKTVKKKAHEQIGPASPYTRIFDESSTWWRKDAEMNKFFLATQQRHANDLLRLNGYLFLNDVLKMLDLTPSDAGQQVGWVYGEGDSFVSFGMWDETKEGTRRFINGDERCIWLDFNVDGVISDRISELERRKAEARRERMLRLL